MLVSYVANAACQQCHRVLVLTLLITLLQLLQASYICAVHNKHLYEVCRCLLINSAVYINILSVALQCLFHFNLEIVFNSLCSCRLLCVKLWTAEFIVCVCKERNRLLHMVVTALYVMYTAGSVSCGTYSLLRSFIYCFKICTMQHAAWSVISCTSIFPLFDALLGCVLLLCEVLMRVANFFPAFQLKQRKHHQQLRIEHSNLSVAFVTLLMWSFSMLCILKLKLLWARPVD